MIPIAAILTLYAAGGFWCLDRCSSMDLYRYPSLSACESDRPRRTLDAEGRGYQGITTTCRAVQGRES